MTIRKKYVTILGNPIEVLREITKNNMKKEYIPIEKIDLAKLRATIDCRKGQFSLRALGNILDISHVALLKKLSGKCPLRKSELQLLAARLGENVETFFLNSPSDAAL